MSYDVIDLTCDLIRFPSVTPADAGCLPYLSDKLEKLGFECHLLSYGEGEQRILNLFARLGTTSPHICYGGHTDVVPAGDETAWVYGAFNPTIKDGILYGRGASDMKGSVAAFVAGVASYLEKHGKPKGSISLLITGDEEADAINGTVKVLDWMKANGHIPDVALVGEPTNPDILGQEIKIGRRGSLNGTLTVRGKQGHVAYQHLADNPLPRLARLVDILSTHILDEGTAYFPKSNLEITTIDVGNKAENIIPATGVARFNVRFNELWTSRTLDAHLRKLLDQTGIVYELVTSSGAESFITQPGEWSRVVFQAVEEMTGRKPAYTTNGGTSDARFVVKHCPVVEFGGINKTIHQVNENANVEDLQNLARIFSRMIELYFTK